ncbi:hypothetical protein OG417_18410 [Actinoallomurus sp. NBC_01490]|uniref:hypothetical protein n=1 Tax=Actinoallomurus sp. NBC_01490 TaxID=2903557 RepID=UPI002E35FC5B|nr:hypothetical protein [Actinoallomurus sp. NBC_01490]
MNDLQVAIVGVWGVILVITQTRSLNRRSSRRETMQVVLSTCLGLVFATLAVLHFTGIHRQKDVHVLGSFIVMLIVLALVGVWQRRNGSKKRT